MTRFVYVLPAGRLRWEVRVDADTLIEAAAEALFNEFDSHHSSPRAWTYAELTADDSGATEGWRVESHIALSAAMPAIRDPQFYRRKARALIAARAIAIVIGGEVQPHNRWGRIQDPDSYGPDPERSVG